MIEYSAHLQRQNRRMGIISIGHIRLWLYHLCGLLMPLLLQAQTIQFTDISVAKQVRGLYVDGRYKLGHGVACADLTGDWLPEIYVSNAAEGQTSYPEILYISHVNAAYTEEAAVRSIADSYGIGSHGVIFFDMDNDGDFDLFNGNTTQAPNANAFDRLYRNNGEGSFTDVTITAGLQQTYYATRGTVAFDANNDGYIDLLSVGNEISTYAGEPYRLYLNQGNGSFVLVDWGLFSACTDGLSAQSVTVVDYNGDGQQDLFVPRVDRWNRPPVIAGDQLLVKSSATTYSDRAATLGLQGSNWSDGGSFADYDNDGDLDLFVACSYDKETRRIYAYKNLSDGTFQDITTTLNLYERGFSTILFDVDNDGDLDLYAISNYNAPDYLRLYLNDGHGQFTRQSGTGLELALFDPRGTAVADFDQDGDLDLYIVDSNKTGGSQYSNHLMRNDLVSENRWLKIYGRGPRGDMGGIGSKVWLFEHGYMDDLNHLVGYKQIISANAYMSQDDPVQHFGLGERDLVDVKIQLTDNSIFKCYSVPALMRLYFRKPVAMEIVSGNYQSGGADQILPLPLCVRLLDGAADPIMGVPVTFAATVGGGSVVESQPTYTDMQGKAQVHFRLGTSALNTVIATTTMNNQISREFTFNTATTAQLRASIQGDAVMLEWYELAGATGYNIYRSTRYDFTPSSANRIGVNVSDQNSGRSGIQFTDNNLGGANVVGDVNVNYFYRVTGLFPAEGTASNVAGEFDYPLITTSGTDINEVVVLFNTADGLTPITNAEELAVAVPYCTNVYQWSATGQGGVGHPKGTVINNFVIRPGFPYMINVTSDGVWSVAGSYVAYQFDLITTTGTDINHISVPLSQSGVSSAEGLASAISNCTNVYHWLASGQGNVGHPKGTPINNFAVQVGYPYYVNVTEGGTWPAGLLKGGRPAQATVAEGVTRGNIPHMAYGAIEPSLGKQETSKLQLRAWIVGREVEVLTEGSVGSYVDGAYWGVSVSNFTTAWQEGERLQVELVDGEGEMRGETEIVLTTAGSDVGKIAMKGEVAATVKLPAEVVLLSNYPNPFNPQTEIGYGLPAAMRVRVRIYDISGREVKELVSEEQGAGFHRVRWDGTGNDGTRVSSGVYLCRLQADGVSRINKIVLTK